MKNLAYACILVALAMSTPTEAQSRIGVNLSTGFGGQATAEVGGLSGDADLDPSVGASVRFEIPVGEVLHLGPIASVDSYKLDGASGRDLGLDAGMLVRAGHTLDIGMPLEVYGAVPFGFSAYFADGNEDTALGFNVGVLAGAQLHVAESIAVMLEMGWHMHRVYQDDVTLMTNQMKMHIGALFLL